LYFGISENVSESAVNGNLPDEKEQLYRMDGLSLAPGQVALASEMTRKMGPSEQTFSVVGREQEASAGGG